MNVCTFVCLNKESAQRIHYEIQYNKVDQYHQSWARLFSKTDSVNDPVTSPTQLSETCQGVTSLTQLSETLPGSDVPNTIVRDVARE